MRQKCTKNEELKYNAFKTRMHWKGIIRCRDRLWELKAAKALGRFHIHFRATHRMMHITLKLGKMGQQLMHGVGYHGHEQETFWHFGIQP